MRDISIIVPVYAGEQETKTALESIVSTVNKFPLANAAVHIVVVNDASPEPAITGYLKMLAYANPALVTLLQNPLNLGFVASVNLGLAVHPDCDAILVNSDAEVFGNWLERLVLCASSGAKVASVTPFSNNATLASYPKTGVPNSFSDNATAAELDALASKVNAGQSIEIPTGVGFCMWMSREALNEVGNFDEAAFGRGYGEENDWCLRATAAGYYHLLSAEVFVRHIGEVSFKADSTGAKIAAQAIMQTRHPHYDALITKHFAVDAARPFRAKLDLARLSSTFRGARPLILMISHHWGGGTEKHIQDLVFAIEGRVDVLVLRPGQGEFGRTNGMLELQFANAGEAFIGYFDADDDYAELLALLQSLRVSRVHLHHVHGLPAQICALASTLSVPLDITLHDYFPITPRYFLDNGGTLDIAIAEQAAAGHAWKLNLKQWRERMLNLLNSAARIISPSQSLAGKVCEVLDFDLRKINIWPHLEASTMSSRSPIYGHLEPILEQQIGVDMATVTPVKVLVLGGLTPEKGLFKLQQIAEDAKQRGLALHFVVLGHTSRVVAQYPTLPIFVRGSFEDANLSTLMVLERADCVLFPSQIPESFSYTLSRALASGLPIVASNLGAFIERLATVDDAQLVAWDAPASVWNAAILKAVAAGTLRTSAVAESNQRYAVQYAKQYLEPIRSMPTDGATAAVAARFLYARKVLPSTGLGLRDLYDNGVLCGHEATKRVLSQRVVEVDVLIAQQYSDIGRLNYDIGRLNNAIASLQSDVADYNESLLDRDAHIGSLNAQLDEAAVEIQRSYAESAALTAQLAEVQNHYEDEACALAEERDAARDAFSSIESSRFWRLTAPARSLVQLFKGAKNKANDIRLSTKRLPRDAAIASQILREEGVVALGKRVQAKLARSREAQPASLRTWALETAIAPLVVPCAESPKFSIIIPVYGQHLLTYTCLKSIVDTCAAFSIEVIVQDDCSPEPASVALADVSCVRFVRNTANLGFLRSVNASAVNARGDYLVILNNDTICTAGWLDAMIKTFTDFMKVGMVGVKLLYPNGTLQEAGGIVWRDGSAWNVGRNQNPDLPEHNYVREVDYCSGACLMLPAALWKQLGGFDDRYAPAYYEETDLAFAVREAGYKVIYQPRAEIVHFEGQSNGTDVTQGMKQYQVLNQKSFASKWRIQLQAHRINGMLPHLERDRQGNTAKRRVLVLDACMLTPDQDSGSLRMFEMLGQMQQLGCKVTFVASNLESRTPYTQDIQALGVEVRWHPYLSSITTLIEREGASFDVIMLSRVTVACQFVDLVRQHAPHAKLIFDTVDLHFLRNERLAELETDAAVKADILDSAKKMRDEELSIIEKSDITLVVSTVEQTLLQEIAPRATVKVVSNIHVNDPSDAGFDAREGILFIGGFRHPPNLDAISWYAENVLPILRRDLPGVVTTCIGSNAPSALSKLEAADFHVAGFVQDIVPAYARARLSISPLRYGAGVKGKVNIAMQYGVPVVATLCSVEGMHLVNGEDALVADTPEAFAAAIVRGYTDAALWRRLQAGGHKNIDTYFSRQTARQMLAKVLDVHQ